jgi:hypothetical protein
MRGASTFRMSSRYGCNSMKTSACVYESSLRVGHGWRESLYRHQGCFKASDCGRLRRQAAGHSWSALRVMKSHRKDCLTAAVLPTGCTAQAGTSRLAWLAGLVGLVLAPSRLGRRIDGLESWTEYGQGHGGCELYLFGHSLHYIGN